MPTTNTVKIFSGSYSTHLAEQIALAYGRPLGGYTCRKFKDGEISPAYDENVRGCDVFLIQSTPPPGDNLLELMLMVDGARRASANKVTIVIPYFGYARQDRKDKPRVAIAAKLIANLLTASGADRLMTIDLHAGQIQGFFDFPVDNLEAFSVFVPYVQGLKLNNLLIASPDVGGATRARTFAKFLNSDMVICDKYRKRANEVASMQVIGDVEGADVVLFDDMIDTGGTLCKAAEIILEKGATSVRAVCTHALMSGKAYDNIENSVLEELIVTDTMPLSQEGRKMKVISVAPLFAKAIGRIRDHESVSSLFLNNQ